MHYCEDGSPVSPIRRRDSLDDRVRRVVDRIPSDTIQELDTPLPLQRDTGISTLVAECLPHCTGEPRTDAVYVLECRSNSYYTDTAIEYLGRGSKPWNGKVESADRLIYVGVTVNLLRRLDEHLNSPGNEGAHFTTVFPPIRILDVSWWSSFSIAKQAEQMIADQLDERYPPDFIFQS